MNVGVSAEEARFGTDGVRGVYGTEVTDDLARRVGASAASILGVSEWVIVEDTRDFNPRLREAVLEGLTSQGARAISIGILPTAAGALGADYMTRMTGEQHAAIALTASHNESDQAGIKVFGGGGNKLSDADTQKVQDSVDGIKIYPISQLEKPKNNQSLAEELRKYYIDYLLNSVDHELRSSRFLQGMSIVIDAANGSAYWSAPYVIGELLGANVSLINGDRGAKINENSGATQPDIIEGAVHALNADYGMALDGDADRLMAVGRNKRGTIRTLDGDDSLVIAARDMDSLDGFDARGIVVTDYSTLGLDRVVKMMGAEVVKVENGDRYVAEGMVRGNYPVGGERSGHTLYRNIANALGTVMTGDGTFTALQHLVASARLGQPLGEISDWDRLPYNLDNIVLPAGSESRKVVQKPEVRQAIEKQKAMVAGTDTFILVRGSGTEKTIARVLVKGEDKEEVDEISRHLGDVIKNAV